MANDMAAVTAFYPVGKPGQPWGDAEKAEWLARQRKQRPHMRICEI